MQMPAASRRVSHGGNAARHTMIWHGLFARKPCADNINDMTARKCRHAGIAGVYLFISRHRLSLLGRSNGATLPISAQPDIHFIWRRNDAVDNIGVMTSELFIAARSISPSDARRNLVLLFAASWRRARDHGRQQ